LSGTYKVAEIDADLGSDIQINIGKDVKGKKIYLQATTKGGVTSMRQFIVNVEAYRCSFTIDPLEAKVQIPFDEMKVLDVFSTLGKAMTITSNNE